jgi:AcrR family transcriptional regulator
MAATKKPEKDASYHRPELKAELLEAAIKLLEKDGLRGFSLRKIASLVGVSHAAPYRHFKNRDELIGAILMEGHRRLTSYLTAALPGAGKAVDSLMRLERAYLAFTRDNSAYLSLMFSREGMSTIASIPKGNKHEIPKEYDSFGVLESCVARCQKEGALDSSLNTAALAMTVWAKVHGLALLMNEGIIEAMAKERGVPLKRAMTEIEKTTRALVGGNTREK